MTFLPAKSVFTNSFDGWFIPQSRMVEIYDALNISELKTELTPKK